MGIRKYFEKSLNEDFLDWWKYEKMSDKITQSKEWQKELQKEVKSGKVSKKLLDKVAKDVLRTPDYKLYQKKYNEIREFIALGLGVDEKNVEKG